MSEFLTKLVLYAGVMVLTTQGGLAQGVPDHSDLRANGIEHGSSATPSEPESTNAGTHIQFVPPVPSSADSRLAPISRRGHEARTECGSGTLEVLFKIIAYPFLLIVGVVWGTTTMFLSFRQPAGKPAIKQILWGGGVVAASLATSHCLDWLLASARNANLFS